VEAADWGEEKGEGSCSEWAVIFIVFVFFMLPVPGGISYFKKSRQNPFLKSSQNPFLVPVAKFFISAHPRRDIFFQKKQANPFLVPVAKFFISTHPRRDIFLQKKAVKILFL
jgi:hypothetical protein